MIINSIRSINLKNQSFGAYLKFNIKKREFLEDTYKSRDLYIKTESIKYIEKDPESNTYYIYTPDINFSFKDKAGRNVVEEIAKISNSDNKVLDLSETDK